MADVNAEVLQNASQDTFGLDYPGGLRRATGLNLDPNGICRQIWGKEFNEAGTEMLQVLSNHALLLPGVSGAYASTPDVAALDIVGDIDIRAELVATTSAQPNPAHVVGKWTTTGAQRSYQLHLGALGLPEIRWSANGTAELSNLNAGITGPSPALRATIDVDNGASGNTSRHYIASSLDGAWTEVDSEIKAGVTSIFSGTAPLTVGAANAGAASFFIGRLNRIEIRNGIDGTVVANPDFRNLAPGTTSFADGTGKTWTINGTAQVI